MTRHDKTSDRVAWLSRIRMGRILMAAIMSEAGVVAILLLAIAVYGPLSPTITDSAYNDLGERIGYYVAPAAGALTVLLSVLWATRRLQSRWVAHGVLIGVVSALLTAGFMAGARSDYRLMYLVAIALRVISGTLGGIIAQWRYDSVTRRSAAMTTTLQEHTR